METAFYDQERDYLIGKRIPVMQFGYDQLAALVEARNPDKDRHPTNNEENNVYCDV